MTVTVIGIIVDNATWLFNILILTSFILGKNNRNKPIALYLHRLYWNISTCYCSWLATLVFTLEHNSQFSYVWQHLVYSGSPHASNHCGPGLDMDFIWVDCVCCYLPCHKCFTVPLNFASVSKNQHVSQVLCDVNIKCIESEWERSLKYVLYILEIFQPIIFK